VGEGIKGGEDEIGVRAALVACIMVAVTAGTLAGPFEEGVAAYDRGDYETAMRLWQNLADRGDGGAQNNLGVMYERDEGVRRDYVRAHMWFNLAATQSIQTAAEGRDRVAKRMTPVQIAEALTLAREWKPTTQPPRYGWGRGPKLPEARKAALRDRRQCPGFCVRFRGIAEVGRRPARAGHDTIDPKRSWRANFAVMHNAPFPRTAWYGPILG